MSIKRTYSGRPTAQITELETRNRTLSRKAAAESFVLLKNDGLLPLKKETPVAIYGNGSAHLIKGGTGSGDVNERESIGLLQGLLEAGANVLNADEARAAETLYNNARLTWRDSIMNLLKGDDGFNFFKIYSTHPWMSPECFPVGNKVSEAKTVIYTISRVAGEGADRFEKAGDYNLSEGEKADLDALQCAAVPTVVLLNTGGQMDVSELLKRDNIKAILLISQPGLDGGRAVADVLYGDVNPSGKLTDTWSKNYSDFPSSATFSHNNGDVEKEAYTDSIYVGYRYFESFGVEPAFCFGYGLSYTSFAISPLLLSTAANTVTVKVTVKNTGAVAGKEVVQIYAACPQNGLKKEYRRLAGFKKTSLLAPGAEEVLTIEIPAKALASFNYQQSGWVLEAGKYGIFAGNSSSCAVISGVINVDKDVLLEKTHHVMPLQEELDEIVRPDEIIDELTTVWQKAAEQLPAVTFAPAYTENAPVTPDEFDVKAAEIAGKLTDEELTLMLLGEVSKGQENITYNELVKTGIHVPGAAGETSGCLEEKYEVPALVMADGPAGVRVITSYDVDHKTGLIYGQTIQAAMENGLFKLPYEHEDCDTYYMYCTAFPIGVALAQTWNPELISEVGRGAALEMEMLNIDWWLAPGMNIHRNPLCGRNFEYYSEEPLVAGTIAAAMTNGVQSVPGRGTTIKHFACNNSEDNRMGVDDIISERALREIYLRGFEIAVREAQPHCIMTSYNLINGVHSANNYDLCTTVARDEWGFKGIIMTDWTTTTNGGSTAYKCAVAGNDLIMPGHARDIENISAALKSGDLDRKDARACAARLIASALRYHQ